VFAFARQVEGRRTQSGQLDERRKEFTRKAGQREQLISPPTKEGARIALRSRTKKVNLLRGEGKRWEIGGVTKKKDENGAKTTLGGGEGGEIINDNPSGG